MLSSPMCNPYRQAILRGEMIPGWSRDQFSEIRIPIRFHNMAPDVFPDREGLVIRLQDGAPEVEAMRWGFPPPPNAGAYYVTNVRNVASGFWKPWLKVGQRCIVPGEVLTEDDEVWTPELQEQHDKAYRARVAMRGKRTRRRAVPRKPEADI